jgi:predicted nucleic acid-binding protein
MGAGKKRDKQSEKLGEELANYWREQIALLGRNIVFVDTGAILEAHTRDDANFSVYFERTTDKFVTSSLVVAETVRRLVKSNPNEFRGPSGGQFTALHFVRTWLVEHHVEILHLPKHVFEYAVRTFEGKEKMGCDLNDIISWVIVNGLEQTRIAAKDRHFSALGLTLYPGDSP